MAYQVQTSHHERGFTLVELLIVISIIGIMATFSVANYLGVKQRSRDAQRKTDMRQLQSALELYRADQSGYPGVLPSCGSALVAAGVTYLQKIPCDPLNSGQYLYRYTGGGATYNVIACLENVNDSQKDTTNNASYCAGGTTNWSHTLTNP